MKGFAIEVKLIEWNCKCTSHPNGVCQNPDTNKQTERGEAYIGSWGYGIKTLAQAKKKWARCVSGEPQ